MVVDTKFNRLPSESSWGLYADKTFCSLQDRNLPMLPSIFDATRVGSSIITLVHNVRFERRPTGSGLHSLHTYVSSPQLKELHVAERELCANARYLLRLVSEGWCTEIVHVSTTADTVRYRSLDRCMSGHSQGWCNYPRQRFE
jgi:hypothetical protein